MNRGDVVRVELPRPRESTGHAQFGRHPAIVLQHQRECQKPFNGRRRSADFQRKDASFRWDLSGQTNPS